MISRAAACARGAALGWALVSGMALVPSPAAAQQEPQPDSAQERIRERLRRLARPPGADSVLFREDSVRLAEAEQGIRPNVAGAADSIVSALGAMPGFTLTRYEGAGAAFSTEDRILVLRAPEDGRARVRREGIEVEADSSITFDESTGLMRTVGMATFTPPGNDPVDAANMIYDMNQARGSATAARTEFSEGGTRWYMSGDMPWAGQDSTFMSHARFTSCDLEEPHYHFESDQIKVVGGRILVARGVRLYFADVPVAWLPFIAQDLEQGRASGLLTPRFSINDIVRTSSGYRRRISNLGFYWAMSDYSDALIAVDWFSDTFFSLSTAFQYRFNRHFLGGGANVRRYWSADGSKEIAFDTNHDWQPDERTRLSIAARYAKADFVREFSFDTEEVTRQVTSTGGVSRRFDWGNLSVNATRNQYLSDDRIEWTLPQANLSFTSRTLFRAPATEARFWNNMTWSSSTNFSRTTVERMTAEADTFSFARADTDVRTAGASTSLSMGKLSVSPSVTFNETRTLSVPEALLTGPIDDPLDPLDPADLLNSAPSRDIARATIGWRTSIRYQQPLVGSTTITPDISFSGDLLRSDTSTLASDFVAAPTRVSFGATLKSDVYGFFPGVGPFEAIRHKITPSITYAWTPAATPTELQRQVFGPRAIQPRNVVALTLNQTFEARRRESEDTAAAAPPLPPPGADSASISDLTPEEQEEPGGPRRIQRPPVTTLLGLTTSVLRYDFVEADSIGQFLAGFETTRLTNQINSDYLRGLAISMSHDLFADSVADGRLVERKFRPHLASLNLGFSLNSRSGIFRMLGLGGDDAAPVEEPVDEGLEEPFEEDIIAEGSMIPERAGGARDRAPVAERPRSDIGQWNANLSFALQRPRNNPDALSRMLSGSVRVRPTENWDLSWRSAYDLEAKAFNDHVIRMTRDLHRWQAHFDFIKTVTGNWTFRFEVSLTDNRDIKFDYRQRNLDVATPREAPSP